MKKNAQDSDLSVVERLRLGVAITLILMVSPALVVGYYVKGEVIHLWGEHKKSNLRQVLMDRR